MKIITISWLAIFTHLQTFITKVTLKVWLFELMCNSLLFGVTTPTLLVAHPDYSMVGKTLNTHRWFQMCRPLVFCLGVFLGRFLWRVTGTRVSFRGSRPTRHTVRQLDEEQLLSPRQAELLEEFPHRRLLRPGQHRSSLGPSPWRSGRRDSEDRGVGRDGRRVLFTC